LQESCKAMVYLRLNLTFEWVDLGTFGAKFYLFGYIIDYSGRTALLDFVGFVDVAKNLGSGRDFTQQSLSEE